MFYSTDEETKTQKVLPTLLEVTQHMSVAEAGTKNLGFLLPCPLSPSTEQCSQEQSTALEVGDKAL